MIATVSLVTGIVLTILESLNVIDIGYFYATLGFWIWIPIYLLIWVIKILVVYIVDKL